MCIIEGCCHPGGRYSPLCSYHRKQDRKHGHPLQPALRPHHLAPYIKIVQQRLKGPGGQAVFDSFVPIWDAFVDACTECYRDFVDGKAAPKHGVEAAKELLGMRVTADPKDILTSLVALLLMVQREPRFFRSDAAFRVSLQRTLRRQCSGAYDLVWNETDQRYARRLRGMTKVASNLLGQWLVDGFAASAGRLAIQILQELDAPRELQRDFDIALHRLRQDQRANRLPFPFKPNRRVSNLRGNDCNDVKR